MMNSETSLLIEEEKCADTRKQDLIERERERERDYTITI